MSPPAIAVTGLTKSFGRTRVLNGIGFAAAEGTVLALLGPNGAGKTTAVRILCTLLRPDAGHAEILGRDVVREPQQVRSVIGLTGQYAAVDDMLSGRENLSMIGRLLGQHAKAARRRADDLLAAFDLTGNAGQTVKAYSGGMRRRLDLAASLLAAPQVIFLDEPTTGLDPRSRQHMWSLVGELTMAGVTVFLTTQYLDEADQLADRIAVLDRGSIVAEGTAAELKATVGGQRLELRCAGGAAYDAIELLAAGRVVRTVPTTLTIAVAYEGGGPGIRALLDELDPDRDRIAEFSVRTASLDDVFMKLTGHTATDPESEPIDD